jgi:hypothetical protein
MSETKPFVAGKLGGTHAMHVQTPPKEFEDRAAFAGIKYQHNPHMTHIQYIGALFLHTYIIAIAAFSATELGNFNAFSYFSFEIMVWVAAGMVTLAGFWTLIVASIGIDAANKGATVKVPPVHRSAAAWFAMMSGWWALSVYYWRQYNGRTGTNTPGEQSTWIELNYSLIFVAMATSYPFWSEVIEHTVLMFFHMCDTKGKLLWMLI